MEKDLSTLPSQPVAGGWRILVIEPVPVVKALHHSVSKPFSRSITSFLECRDYNKRNHTGFYLKGLWQGQGSIYIQSNGKQNCDLPKVNSRAWEFQLLPPHPSACTPDWPVSQGTFRTRGEETVSNRHKAKRKIYWIMYWKSRVRIQRHHDHSLDLSCHPQRPKYVGW
jgi:hypothetical protein